MEIVPLFRTAAGAAGLSTSTAVAVGLGVLNRSRRRAVNVLASAGTELSLALAGVELDVIGAEHLWSQRPAVFVFNHQSVLDVLVIANLVQRDVTTGAFHLAQQAKVPVVPVVLDGTGALMPPGSLLIHPGVVHVSVLEPLDVTAWGGSEFGARAELLRGCFVEEIRALRFRVNHDRSIGRSVR